MVPIYMEKSWTSFIFQSFTAICIYQILLSLICDLVVIRTFTNAALDIDQPYFDDISPRNVTTVVDETVILKCRVKNKGNRTVSWMRKRDLHILTSNRVTYTGDQRFQIIHPQDSDEWDLKITSAQSRDSGLYECQVNTEPKINLAVSLIVTDRNVQGKSYSNDNGDAYAKQAARAKIMGSSDVHVKKGSTISLSCVVNIHASSVSWYHGSLVVDFDSARGGISLETEKTESGTSSRLMLTRAALRDSGNYTCVPTGAVPASVQVHVLNGEQPAAMQTSGCFRTAINPILLFTLLTTTYLIRRIGTGIHSNLTIANISKRMVIGPIINQKNPNRNYSVINKIMTVIRLTGSR